MCVCVGGYRIGVVVVGIVQYSILKQITVSYVGVVLCLLVGAGELLGGLRDLCSGGSQGPGHAHREIHRHCQALP